MSSWPNPVECSDFTDEETRRLAATLNLPEDVNLYDGTREASHWTVENARRLKQAEEGARVIMRALFLLRTAYIFEPTEEWQGNCDPDLGLGLTEYTFEQQLKCFHNDSYNCQKDEFVPARYIPCSQFDTEITDSWERLSRLSSLIEHNDKDGVPDFPLGDLDFAQVLTASV